MRTCRRLRMGVRLSQGGGDGRHPDQGRPGHRRHRRAGRIVAIEADRAESADRVIDAHGSVVAPGFIDIHTHSDFTLPLNPRAEAKIRQGVTTEVKSEWVWM